MSMPELIPAAVELMRAPASVVLAAGNDGILNWGTQKNTEVQNLLRGIAVTAGIIFVIYHAWVSKLAVARVIIAGIAAGVFVWFVWNVTAVKDRVDTEVSAMVVQVDAPVDVTDG